jgi:hypothetical protein
MSTFTICRQSLAFGRLPNSYPIAPFAWICRVGYSADLILLNYPFGPPPIYWRMFFLLTFSQPGVVFPAWPGMQYMSDMFSGEGKLNQQCAIPNFDGHLYNNTVQN